MPHRPRSLSDAYVDTPEGLFTADGVWYRVTEAGLHEYAGPVLERVPLPQLLRDAGRWLRAPQTLAVWAGPPLLWALDPLPAALALLTVYVGAAVLAPSFVTRPATALLRLLDPVIAQGLYYVATLSVLAQTHPTATVVVGLAAFVLLRWQLVDRLARPVVKPLQARLYDLSLPDQVLRALIIRTALKHRLALPGLEAMERAMIARWQASGKQPPTPR